MQQISRFLTSLGVVLLLMIPYVFKIYPFQSMEFFIYFYLVFLALAFYITFKLTANAKKGGENYFFRPNDDPRNKSP